MFQQHSCPICSAASQPLDVVDFNKSCVEGGGKYLPLSGIPIYYFRCGVCGFCFAPEIYKWAKAEFEERIYNREYAEVDPDHSSVRPRANAENLIQAFGDKQSLFKHLDYGGGSGLMSALLCEAGWKSVSHDPFYNKEERLEDLGNFDLITAYEVFEHVPDVSALMSDLRSLLTVNGIVLFSTQLSDGYLHSNQRITWWYASPRNGHISLFSRKSLSLMAKREGLNLASFSNGLHALYKTVPAWANHIIRPVPKFY